MRANNDRHEDMIAAHGILERCKIALCNPECGIGRDYREAAGKLPLEELRAAGHGNKVEYVIAKDIEKAMSKVRDWITCRDCDEPQGQCECFIDDDGWICYGGA